MGKQVCKQGKDDEDNTRKIKRLKRQQGVNIPLCSQEFELYLVNSISLMFLLVFILKFCFFKGTYLPVK